MFIFFNILNTFLTLSIWSNKMKISLLSWLENNPGWYTNYNGYGFYEYIFFSTKTCPTVPLKLKKKRAIVYSKGFSFINAL